MRAAADDSQRLLRRHGMNAARLALLWACECPNAGNAPVGEFLRGRAYYAQHRFVLHDQCDVDGEFSVALDEFARAVERIDDPQFSPGPPLRPGPRAPL